MNTYQKTALTIVLAALSGAAFAQNSVDAQTLIKQGIQLNDQGKYTDAIAKYNAALKIEPDNLQADFEMGYTLFASGHGKEGIPFLEKVVQSKTAMTDGAYDLLGSIYDDDKQYDKAIELYKEGIKSNPKYQRLYYNLSLSYYRQRKLAEAEASAIDAIKLEPTHASSHLSYALACYDQNKQANALLGLCNFLLIESQTKRSAQAYALIKKIMQGGVSKTDDKHTTINIGMDKGGNTELNASNLALSLAAVQAQNDQKSLPPIQIMQSQLTSIFSITGELSAKSKSKDFFATFYADFFYKLAQTNNMAAFTHYISLNDNKEEHTKWLQDNHEQLISFQTWLKATPRNL